MMGLPLRTLPPSGWAQVVLRERQSPPCVGRAVLRRPYLTCWKRTPFPVMYSLLPSSVLSMRSCPSAESGYLTSTPRAIMYSGFTDSRPAVRPPFPGLGGGQEVREQPPVQGERVTPRPPHSHTCIGTFGSPSCCFELVLKRFRDSLIPCTAQV